MNLPRNILVPIDFGEPSLRALDYAIDLAHAFGARVHVLHVFDLPIVGFAEGALIPSGEVVEAVRRTALRSLEEAVAPRKNRDVPISSLLEYGGPHPVILAAIEATDADLVVMGTHGRQGVKRALLGSVAEHVVRTSPRPVLTVRGAVEPKGAAAHA